MKEFLLVLMISLFVICLPIAAMNGYYDEECKSQERLIGYLPTYWIPYNLTCKR